MRYWDGATWTPHVTHPPSFAGHPAPFAAPAQRPARPPLDETVQALAAEDGRPWGWRPVLLPIGAFIALIVLGQVDERRHPAEQLRRQGRVRGRGQRDRRGDRVGSDRVARRAQHRRSLRRLGTRVRLAAPAAGSISATRALGVRRRRSSAAIVIGVVANALTHGHASKESQNLELDNVDRGRPSRCSFARRRSLSHPSSRSSCFAACCCARSCAGCGFWPAALFVER